MTCFYPMQGLKLSSQTKSGKNAIVFVKKSFADSYPDKDRLLVLPCGRCVGCRLERSRQWAIRCEKEIQMVEAAGGGSSFITLTFDDKHLFKRPNPWSLDKTEFPKFMKRLRFRITDPDDKLFFIHREHRVRYFHCGEYGDEGDRPHYHAILFNYYFDDLIYDSVKNGHTLYTSPKLQLLWPYGKCIVGKATFDSCAYVARYIMKKRLGKDAISYYLSRQIIPEYVTMSRRSGIGKTWLDEYLQDVYPSDRIFLSDKKVFCQPPKYFDSVFEIHNPTVCSDIKAARKAKALERAHDNTPERLAVKRKIFLNRTRLLSRRVK